MRGQAQDATGLRALFARALELQQAGDMLGAIDTYKAALAIIPDRADALSNLGAAYVRLGQYDDAIAQYEAALKADPIEQHGPPESGARVLQVGAARTRPFRSSSGSSRPSPDAKNAYLVLADCYLQTGQDQELVALLKPREQMFGDDLAYAFLLGTALLHTARRAEGQKYVDRDFRRRRVRRSAPADGHRASRPQDYPAAKTELAARRAVQSAAADGALAVRPVAAGAWASRTPRSAHFARSSRSTSTTSRRTCSSVTCERRRRSSTEASTYLERATTIRPDDLAARKLLASLRLQTGKVEEAVAHARGDRRRRRPISSKRTCSSRPLTTG